MLAMLTGLSHVAVLQPSSHWLCRNLLTPGQLLQEGQNPRGKVSFEPVPGCPGFFWATDCSLRLIGSCGQGNVS